MRGTGPQAVLTRLMHLAEGISKHAHDPGFPDLSWIGDPAAAHSALADALVKAHALRDQWKSAAAAARAELTRDNVLAQKLAHAILAWAGTRADVLRDFGLAPHKVPAKRARKAEPRHTGKGRSAKHAAEAGAVSSGGDSTSPAPTPAASPGAGSASSGK